MKNKGMKIAIILALWIVLLGGIVFGEGTQEVSDRIGIFRDVHVTKDMVVKGSTVAIFGDITMEGIVRQDMIAVFGDMKVNGTVEGDIVTIFGRVTLNPQAKILGDAVTILGDQSIEAPGATIRGEKVDVLSFTVGNFSGITLLLFFIFIVTVGKIILGYVFSIIAILAFPERFDNMSTIITQDMGKSFIMGILVIVGYYVLAIILLMVVIGIPLLLLLAPFVGLLAFIGNTTVKLAIGEKVAQAMNKTWSQMMKLFVGTVIYGMIELTIIGKSVVFVGKAIGIGTAVDTKFGKRISPMEPPKTHEKF